MFKHFDAHVRVLKLFGTGSWIVIFSLHGIWYELVCGNSHGGDIAKFVWNTK